MGAHAQNFLNDIKRQGIALKQRLLAGENRDKIAPHIDQRDLPRSFRDDADVGRLFDAITPSVALAWCESGFPTVTVGHRLAASLMCTSYTDDVRQLVHAPWPCFHLAVPTGVLQQEADLLVWSQPGGVRVLTFLYAPFIASASSLLIETEHQVGDYAESDSINDIKYVTLETDPIPDNTELTVREARLRGRFLVGACIELDMPKIRETIVLGPRYKTGINRRGEPASWVFQLSRPVTIDLREQVRSYVTGARGGTLSMQHLVRGHWKRQPVGPERLDRKWIHIEPYWRGDENAPLPLRTHVVTG